MSESHLPEDEDRLISARPAGEDGRFEATLRPTRMAEYIGQAAMKDRLGIYLESARNRNEALDHVLIFGPHSSPHSCNTSLSFRCFCIETTATTPSGGTITLFPNR
jgi:Holliday junction resolvasome RuvABC ATP-dependent DNA helicase subunit